MGGHLNPIIPVAGAERACTNCGRCKAACPAGIDIPAIIKGEIKPFSDFTGPEDCIECGACTACCPEKIAVKDLMRELAMRQCRHRSLSAYVNVLR